MADKYKCTGSGVRIRSGPGTNYKILGSMYKGEVVEVSEKQGGWYKTSKGGWSSANYLMLVQQAPVAVPPVQTVTEKSNVDAETYRKEVDLAELTEEKKSSDYPDEEPMLADYVSTDEEYLNDISNAMKTSTSRGIFGMPYQFLPIVDNRVDSDPNSFGRKFADKIVSKMPILVLTPGKPKFMKGMSAAKRRSFLENALDIVNGNGGASLNSIIGEADCRYYNFDVDWVEYYKYVNQLCKMVAIYMGVDDEIVDGERLGSINWAAKSGEVEKIIRYTKAISFYIDSDKQINENFSNSTTTSMLKDQINGLSDYAREAQFILGSGPIGEAVDRFSQDESITKNIETANDFIDKIMLGNSGIFTRLTSNIQTIVAGGKMVFPEIWSDSELGGGTYDITIKLASPYPTKVGLFLDIMVPIIHCICFTAPRAMGANGYISPMLVRGFYKGQYQIDMGIVTSLSINKGQEGYWSREGIPTCAEIQMTIKDLYNSFSISKTGSGRDGAMNNIGLLDYLANMAGVNVNEHDVFRQIELYLASSGLSRLAEIIRYDIFQGMEQWKDSLADNIYTSIFR